MRQDIAYAYQADVWCENCAQQIMADIRANHPDQVPEDDMDQASYDSGEWPKGYMVDFEECDCPQHCAGCQTFLRNPLTSEGYAYVKAQLDATGPKLGDVAQEWADYYSFQWHAECQACDYDEDECECTQPVIVREWRSSEMF